jgi:hypothetical protein
VAHEAGAVGDAAVVGSDAAETGALPSGTAPEEAAYSRVIFNFPQTGQVLGTARVHSDVPRSRSAARSVPARGERCACMQHFPGTPKWHEDHEALLRDFFCSVAGTTGGRTLRGALHESFPSHPEE